MMKFFIIVLLIILSCNIFASPTDMYTFQNISQQQQFQGLVQQLRCLVCQNENLADSNATLANDLRKQVYTMVTQGKSNQYIISYLTDRYGQFILFKPRVEPITYVLWFAPFLLIAIGFWVLIKKIRKQ